MDSKKCMEIYEYCQNQYRKLEKKDKCYNPKHDKVVMGLASKQFKMSEEAIEKAFDLAAHILLKTGAHRKPLKASFST